MFGPSSVGSTTTASADIRHPIPTSHDAGSTRQGNGSPRVRRVTFVPYTRRIYGRTFRVISGFGFYGPLAQMRTPHAIPVRQAGTLLTASFRFPLAVRLTVPITRARRGLPPPSHWPDTIPASWRQSRRFAPCLAHHQRKEPGLAAGFLPLAHKSPLRPEGLTPSAPARTGSAGPG